MQTHNILGHSKDLSQRINTSYAMSGKYLSLLIELLEIVSTLLRDTITFVDGKLRVFVEYKCVIRVKLRILVEIQDYRTDKNNSQFHIK